MFELLLYQSKLCIFSNYVIEKKYKNLRDSFVRINKDIKCKTVQYDDLTIRLRSIYDNLKFLSSHITHRTNKNVPKILDIPLNLSKSELILPSVNNELNNFVAECELKKKQTYHQKRILILTVTLFQTIHLQLKIVM